jgi:hypothetical protein
MSNHLIITRLAIKWRYSETGKSWDEWLNDSLYLMNKYCRSSLSQQTNQDFTLLTIVDSSVNKYGNCLDNEIILKVSSGDDYPRQQIIDSINNYISTLNYNNIITTRLDRDDCLRNDFIDNVKKYFQNIPEGYVDIRNCYTFDSENKDVRKFIIQDDNYCTPFVSMKEKVRDNKIGCISMLYDHPDISKYCDGFKSESLSALQVIHGNNISNVMFGNQEEIDLKRYGI